MLPVGPPIVLAIEASTPKGSVALFRDGKLRHRLDVAMGTSREDQLFPAIQNVLKSESLTAADLSAIVCGNGPGSFTSLRIAGALAKGLAHAANIPLFAVSSLLLSAAAFGRDGRHDGEYVVHSEALRNERYVLPVMIAPDGTVNAAGDTSRINGLTLRSFANGRGLLSVLGNSSSTDEIPVVPDAGALMHLSHWMTIGRVDLIGWEPAYGRLAEAQVKWEATHQQPLPST